MRNKKLFLTKAALFLVLIFTLWSCEDTSEIKKHNWELTWQDEFNDIPADKLPDATKWTYDLGAGGWGNAEWQTYTKSSQNVAIDLVDGVGCLKITAGFDGSTYTSARIKTQGLFEQGYGRFEARIKLPYGPGIWPAFWLLGNNKETVNWPQCGEIDIMEYKGQERTEENIDFYVDETLYKRITRTEVESKKGEWVYDHPFFIILNLAVGGNFSGYPNEFTIFPQTMYVDYVRVYKEAI